MPRSKAVLIAAAVLTLAPIGADAAPAPSVADDVRCLLIATGFARAAADDATRRSVTLTGAFYLGRLSAHLAEPAVAAAIRAQGAGMSGAEAQPIMKACAARAAAAEQQLTTTVRLVQAKPR